MFEGGFEFFLAQPLCLFFYRWVLLGEPSSLFGSTCCKTFRNCALPTFSAMSSFGPPPPGPETAATISKSGFHSMVPPHVAMSASGDIREDRGRRELATPWAEVHRALAERTIGSRTSLFVDNKGGALVLGASMMRLKADLQAEQREIERRLRELERRERERRATEAAPEPKGEKQVNGPKPLEWENTTPKVLSIVYNNLNISHRRQRL